MNRLSDLVRGLAGLVSIFAGVIWAVPLLLSASQIVSYIASPQPAFLLIAIAIVIFLISVFFMGLFAFGIYSSRFGSERPALWLSCLICGCSTVLLAAALY